MKTDPQSVALARIEAAAARIDAAAKRLAKGARLPDGSGADGAAGEALAALESRHARLRSAVAGSLSELDLLIETVQG